MKGGIIMGRLTIDLHTVGMYNQKSFEGFPNINELVEDVLVHLCRCGYFYYSAIPGWRVRDSAAEYKKAYFEGRIPTKPERDYIIEKVQFKCERKLKKHYSNIENVNYNMAEDKLYIVVK